MSLSPKCVTQANVYAPNGTILLNQFTMSTGAFFAKDVTVGHDAVVGLGSAFNVTGRAAMGGVDDEAAPGAAVPTEYGLSQNYPNPFNPTTTIRYDLPEAGPVSIVVYNTFGEEVARLVDGDRPAGFHEAVWDGRNLSGVQVSTGVYFYRIDAGSFREVRKMVLMK